MADQLMHDVFADAQAQISFELLAREPEWKNGWPRFLRHLFSGWNRSRQIVAIERRMNEANELDQVKKGFNFQ